MTVIAASPVAQGRLSYSYVPLLLDAFARWIAWKLCRTMHWSDLALWLFQLLAVPITVFAISSAKEAYVRRRAGELGFGEYTAPITAMRFSACLLATVIAADMAYRHLSSLWGWAQVLLTVIGTAAYVGYLSVLWLASIRLDDYAIEAELKPSRVGIDDNDRAIIELDAKAASLKQRVDTYTLESALFGALAFSAFVTIVAADHQDNGGVRELIDAVPQCATLLLRLRLADLWVVLEPQVDPKKLLAVVALETLICSLMFLAVIICRLRFTDLVGDVDKSIRIAEAFNEKEEDIHKITLQNPDRENELKVRLDDMTARITHGVQDARAALTKLSPVVTYMSGFRRFGVLGFLIVLVTSAMWIDSRLALLFFGLGTIAVLYPMADGFIRDKGPDGKRFTWLVSSVAALRKSLLRV
jgi:hypothetical protein